VTWAGDRVGQTTKNMVRGEVTGRGARGASAGGGDGSGPHPHVALRKDTPPGVIAGGPLMLDDKVGWKVGRSREM
jgi:hypothetical protein